MVSIFLLSNCVFTAKSNFCAVSPPRSVSARWEVLSGSGIGPLNEMWAESSDPLQANHRTSPSITMNYFRCIIYGRRGSEMPMSAQLPSSSSASAFLR